MLLMIDNYDSFTYNLVQYFGELGETIEVFRNDKISIPEIEKLDPEVLVISPGPGSPKDAGISLEVIHHFKGVIPILGVCLGHQCIGEAFGGKIVAAPRLMHGKVSLIHHTEKDIFRDLPNPFEATRYHSLIIESESLPDSLSINAWTAEQEIMGVHHKKHLIRGVQFHPESILTKEGKRLLNNFLLLARNAQP
jgi:anthranilate synthase/aminodeoxychorismate synthase-like glutamine amidotransferase